jgi:REP element-mobilizing transposase RayT
MADKYLGKYRIPTARLQTHDYSSNGAYFITICTSGRQHFFGEIKNGIMNHSLIGEIAHQCWIDIPKHFPFVKLDAHIIMPNHTHGIIIIDKPTVIQMQNIANLNDIGNTGNHPIQNIANPGDHQIQNITNPGDHPIQNIANPGDHQIQNITNPGDHQIQNIANPGDHQIQNITNPGDHQIQNIANPGDHQIQNITNPGDHQIQNIANPGDHQIQNITNPGDHQIQNIANPGDHQIQNIANPGVVQTQNIASLRPDSILKIGMKSIPKNKFGPQSQNLASIIRGFKTGVTVNARKTNPSFGWQARFHDSIIRDNRAYTNIRNYIINNPTKWEEDS